MARGGQGSEGRLWVWCSLETQGSGTAQPGLYPMAMPSRPQRFSEGSCTPATSFPLHPNRVSALSVFSVPFMCPGPLCRPLSPAPGTRRWVSPRGHSTALRRPRSGRPRVPSPFTSPSIQQPDPAAPTLPSPPAVPARPGLALRAPLGSPRAAYPSSISSRSSGAAGRGSGRWAMVPRLLRRLRGAEEVRAGTSPGGAIPARPASPRRPGAPKGETPTLGRSTRSPSASSGARCLSHTANALVYPQNNSYFPSL